MIVRTRMRMTCLVFALYPDKCIPRSKKFLTALSKVSLLNGETDKLYSKYVVAFRAVGRWVDVSTADDE